MVRWLSESKGVRLPKERVQVNYLYTWPYGLKEVQELVSNSLKEFGEWGSEYLNVWICRNDREWEEAHRRLITSMPKKFLKEWREATARLVYSPKEMQDILSVKEEKLLKPNLIINAKEFFKAEEARKPIIKHEFSHKFQIDYGYYEPIQKAFMEFTEKHIYGPFSKDFTTLFTNLKVACDDISANEVCIDFGFKDDVFILSKYNFNRFKSEGHEKERTRPIDWFLPVMLASSYPVPFEHKGEKDYARKMREVVDDYLKQIKSFDAVSLREEFEEILDKVRNPTKLSELEAVYEGIERKFDYFLKEM